MGLRISLQDEFGKEREAIDDPRNLLHRFLPQDRSHVLGVIDWVGDTTFNRLQMDQFIHEWNALRDEMHSAEEKQLFRSVLSLAQHCQKNVHLYLKFIGD